MIKFIVLFLYFASLYAGNVDFENSLEAAKKLSRSLSEKITNLGNQISIEDLKSVEDKGKTFDAKEANERVKTNDLPNNSISEFLMSSEVLKNNSQPVNPEEYFVKKGNEVLEDPEKFMHFVESNEATYDYEKCHIADEPFFVSYDRQLQVNVVQVPEIKKTVKFCLGHENSTKHTLYRFAQKDKEKLEKRFAQDPTIKSSYVKISKGGLLKDYKLKWQWTHLDDSSTCDHFSLEEKVVQSASLQEEDSWKALNYDPLTESPQCTFIGKECLDNTPKDINGKAIERQCWLEKINYLCRIDNSQGCNFLKNRQCILVNKQCILEGIQGCAKWELLYKCISKNKKNFTAMKSDELQGLEQSNWDTQYESNTSFNQMTTTLSIFEALKSDLENSQTFDATQAEIFKGSKSQCSKNVAENIMYDCCFSYKGLANDLKLSKCTADELALADLRERGLCHYVGKYDEKFLQAWKSRTEHVYCCFPNKLARVFQEQAREQLGIDWGSAKHPNCRGFTSDELSRIDFAKLDLSEAVELGLKDSELSLAENEAKKKEKLELIENSIKNRISEINGS